MLAISIAAIFLSVVAGLAIVGSLPFAVLAVYLVASLFASLAYAVDKLAAGENRRRIPESTLHLLGLAGGWPGALVARHVFRHKTMKQPFIVAFWGTVVLNCCALVWMLSPPGQRFLHALLGTV